MGIRSFFNWFFKGDSSVKVADSFWETDDVFQIDLSPNIEELTRAVPDIIPPPSPIEVVTVVASKKTTPTRSTKGGVKPPVAKKQPTKKAVVTKVAKKAPVKSTKKTSSKK